MQYQLITRHAHMNDKLGRYVGVGDLVHSDDPALVEELLLMRGGHTYGQVSGFGAISGQGFAYFTPENFKLQQLQVELAKKAAAAKAQADAVAKAAAEAKAQAEALAKKPVKAALTTTTTTIPVPETK